MSTATRNGLNPIQLVVGVLVLLLINVAAGMVANAFDTRITGNAQLFVWIGSALIAILTAKSI